MARRILEDVTRDAHFPICKDTAAQKEAASDRRHRRRLRAAMWCSGIRHQAERGVAARSAHEEEKARNRWAQLEGEDGRNG